MLFTLLVLPNHGLVRILCKCEDNTVVTFCKTLLLSTFSLEQIFIMEVTGGCTGDFFLFLNVLGKLQSWIDNKFLDFESCVCSPEGIP